MGRRQRADRHQPDRHQGDYKPGPISIPDPPPYLVEVTLPTGLAGQPISLLHNGQVIGKAIIAVNGAASIPAAFGDGSVKPGELEVAIEGDGVQPVKAPVSGVPQATPKMTQSCPQTAFISGPNLTGTMTITGTLIGPPAGSTVSVTYKGTNIIADRTATLTATTDACGAWSTSLPLQRSDQTQNQGTWTVTSSYAGNSQFTASSAGPCSVAVVAQPG